MTNANAPYVFCEDVFKIYKIADLEVVALRGLDLVVQPGEVVAIVGASGSGKSTLLNILAGYDTPSAGGVTVGGKDLLRMTAREVEEYRRADVGFIWQQTSRNLFPYLSTLENVTLPMMLTNTPGAERRERAEELLNLVGTRTPPRPHPRKAVRRRTAARRHRRRARQPPALASRRRTHRRTRRRHRRRDSRPVRLSQPRDGPPPS